MCSLLGRLLSCPSNDISSLGKRKAGSKPLHKEFHFKPCIELFLGQPELSSKDCEKSPLSPLPLRRVGSCRGDIWKEGPFPQEVGMWRERGRSGGKSWWGGSVRGPHGESEAGTQDLSLGP